MPRRKITLEEAFAVFEEHGLKVKVEAVERETKPSPLSDFLEVVEPAAPPLPQQVSGRKVRITLHTQHTIACGGRMIYDDPHDKAGHVEGSSVETYGPGVVAVPAELAQQLLHQDGLARSADERMLDNKLRTYVVVPHGSAHRAIQVSDDSSFDMSGFLGKLGEHSMYKL